MRVKFSNAEMIEFGSLEMFGTPTDFAVRLYSGTNWSSGCVPIAATPSV
jgi:hypothetical protein